MEAERDQTELYRSTYARVNCIICHFIDSISAVHSYRQQGVLRTQRRRSSLYNTVALLKHERLSQRKQYHELFPCTYKMKKNLNTNKCLCCFFVQTNTNSITHSHISDLSTLTISSQ